MQGWINTCEKEHEEHCASAMPQMSKRILKISQNALRLIETEDIKAHYLTLRHCWGSTYFVSLTSTNLAAM
jgi:hypothetical protein